MSGSRTNTFVYDALIIQKQKIIDLAETKAEFVSAVASTAQDMMYIKHWFDFQLRFL